MSIAKTGQAPGGERTEKGDSLSTDAGHRPGYRSALVTSRSFARPARPESWFYVNTSIF
jgi:hypothetical protein